MSYRRSPLVSGPDPTSGTPQVAVGDPTQIEPQLAELALGPVAYRNPDGESVAPG